MHSLLAPCLGSTSLKLSKFDRLLCVHHRLVKLSTEKNETGCCVTYFSASFHQWPCLRCCDVCIDTTCHVFLTVSLLGRRSSALILNGNMRRCIWKNSRKDQRPPLWNLKPLKKWRQTSRPPLWSPQPSESGIPEMIKEAICCSHVFWTVAELWSLMMITQKCF